MSATDLHTAYCYAANRKTDIGFLHERVRAYPLPRGWRVSVADSSITVASPKRTRVVKMDTYRTVDIDRATGKGATLQVSSVRHQCTSLDHTWEVFSTTLNSFLGREAVDA